MPCPLCNQTMHNLGLDQGRRRSFWCPNCGTVKTESLTLVQVLDPETRAVIGTKEDVFEEHETPRMCKPIYGVPEPTVRLAFLWRLMHDDARGVLGGTFDTVKSYLDSRVGEAGEAIKKMKEAKR